MTNERHHYGIFAMTATELRDVYDRAFACGAAMTCARLGAEIDYRYAPRPQCTPGFTGRWPHDVRVPLRSIAR